MRIPICRRFFGASVLALVPVIGGAQPLATTPPPAGAKAAAPKVPAATRPPKPESAARDLVVELRERAALQQGAGEASAPAAYVVSTLPADGGVPVQQVRVQSGEKAVLRLVHSTPMQWMLSGQQATNNLAVGGATAAQNSAGITQAITTVEAGHTLVVTPHWAGTGRPVRVDVQWQSDTVAERTGAELPTTTRRQFSTTVRMPLQQWVTIATRGATPSAGSYSSAGAMEPLRALQLRVSLP